MYVGAGKNTGMMVPESDALSFAMAACGIMRPFSVAPTEDSKEFDSMLVEWFFSGNWIKESAEDLTAREVL